MKYLLLLLTLLVIILILYNNSQSKPYFTIEEAKQASQELNIKFDQFTLKDLWIGMNIELEHGYCDPETNVTNDDLLVTAKIAWKHLKIDPNIYKIKYPMVLKQLNDNNYKKCNHDIAIA